MTAIERKIYGTLVAMSDDNNMVRGTTMRAIAMRAGYKTSGGAISLALQMLEMRNRIIVRDIEDTKKIEVEVLL